MLGRPPSLFTDYTSIHRVDPTWVGALAAGEGRAVELQRLLIYLLVFHTSISRDVRGGHFLCGQAVTCPSVLPGVHHGLFGGSRGSREAPVWI